MPTPNCRVPILQMNPSRVLNEPTSMMRVFGVARLIRELMTLGLLLDPMVSWSLTWTRIRVWLKVLPPVPFWPHWLSRTPCLPVELVVYSTPTTVFSSQTLASILPFLRRARRWSPAERIQIRGGALCSIQRSPVGSKRTVCG